MQTKTTTETTKTFVQGDVQMKITKQDGDITRIMFHRRIVLDNSREKWQHMFSLKESDMFSYSVIRELLFSLCQLCYRARDILIGLGG